MMTRHFLCLVTLSPPLPGVDPRRLRLSLRICRSSGHHEYICFLAQPRCTVRIAMRQRQITSKLENNESLLGSLLQSTATAERLGKLVRQKTIAVLGTALYHLQGAESPRSAVAIHCIVTIIVPLIITLSSDDSVLVSRYNFADISVMSEPDVLGERLINFASYHDHNPPALP